VRTPASKPKAATAKTSTKKAADPGLTAFEKARKKNLRSALELFATDDTLALRALRADPSLLSQWQYVSAAVDAVLDGPAVAAGLAVYQPWGSLAWFEGWDVDLDAVVARAWADDAAAFAGLVHEHEATRLGVQLVTCRFGEAVVDDALNEQLMQFVIPQLAAKRVVTRGGIVTSRRTPHGLELFDEVYGAIYGSADAFVAALRRHTIETKSAVLVPHALRGATDDELRALFAIVDGSAEVRFAELFDGVVDAGISAARLVKVIEGIAADQPGASPAAYVAASLDSAAFPPALDARLDGNPCRFVVDIYDERIGNDVPLLLRGFSQWPRERIRAVFDRQQRDPAQSEAWWHGGEFLLALVGRIAVDNKDFAALVTLWQRRRALAEEHASSWESTQRAALLEPYSSIVLGGIDVAKGLFALAPDDDDQLRKHAVLAVKAATQLSAPVAADDAVMSILMWDLKQWVAVGGGCVAGLDDDSKARFRAACLADPPEQLPRVGEAFGGALREEHLARWKKQKKAMTEILVGAIESIPREDDDAWTGLSWVSDFVSKAALKLSAPDRERLVSRLGPRVASVWPG
jgi:hypothetical protein